MPLPLLWLHGHCTGINSFFLVYLNRHISHFMHSVPFPSPQRPRILVQVRMLHFFVFLYICGDTCFVFYDSFCLTLDVSFSYLHTIPWICLSLCVHHYLSGKNIRYCPCIFSYSTTLSFKGNPHKQKYCEPSKLLIKISAVAQEIKRVIHQPQGSRSDIRLIL